MLVIAILSVLSSIGAPSLLSAMYKTKRTEVITVSQGIYTAQRAYEARWDSFVDAPTYHPRETLTRQKSTWTHTGELAETLGYGPDGKVWGKYMSVRVSQRSFTVTGQVDVDGDRDNAIYKITFDEDAGTLKEQGFMTSDITY
jgi:type II secretory pathway pseudopilin PulG